MDEIYVPLIHAVFCCYLFSYTLFPLLLLLEAAVNCRSSSNDKLKEGEKPPKISDIVAEGALQCLDELLIQCHLGSMEQVFFKSILIHSFLKNIYFSNILEICYCFLQMVVILKKS